MREHILALLSKYLPGPFKHSGSNIVHKCPFHKDGKESSPSFGVNVEKGIFNCFTCHEAGDLRRLLKLFGASRSMIDSELSIISPELKRQKELHQLKNENFFTNADPFKAEYVLPEVMNSLYEWMPVSLAEKGFDPALLQDMEIGFDRENNRIMYPIRDAYGALAGFSGGAISPEQKPKYKVYQGGRKQGSLWVPSDFGKWFDEQQPGFHCVNHNYLWNYNRVFPRLIEVRPGADDVVYVVEGFKACLWMIQAGFINTVAAMGSYLSERQQRLLHRLGGTIVLCFDNDDAGRKATQQVGRLLWGPSHGKVKVLPYPTHHDRTQPDDYSLEDLRKMVLSATPYVDNQPPRRQFNSSENKQWQ